MARKPHSELYSQTGDYETAPKADWVATAIALVATIIIFYVLKMYMSGAEDRFIEAAGELIYQVKQK